MNLSESFADYLETLSGATLGQDLFIGNAPSSNKVQDTIYWIVATGGNIVTNAVSGETEKLYSVEIYFRSRNYKQVYDTMYNLEKQLNCERCSQLEGFDTVDMRASVLSIDSDLDNVDRKVGLLQVDVTIYEDCLS